MNQVEAHPVVIRVTGHTILSGRAFGEKTGMISAMFCHSLPDFSVAIKTFELRTPEGNGMTLCAMCRAFKDTVRLCQGSRRDLRLRS